LEARLLAHSKTTGLSLVRLRKQVVFERFLARLQVAAPDRWILKGGFALDLRLGVHARPTKDVDLGRHDDENATTVDMIAAQVVDIGDYFQFQVERTAALDELIEGSAVRYRVGASLAGRRFEQVVVDVGFGGAYPVHPDLLDGTRLLEFAGVGTPRFPVIPLPQHIAEKLHAYVRMYGPTGRPSTRVKDLIDMVLISSYERFIAAELRRGLNETFNARGARTLPDELAAPPKEWRVPYAKLAAEVSLSEDVADGYSIAARFLNPILRGNALGDDRWDPQLRAWVRL
jgi:predicted nucleotidyltransferase component of viral defense system